MASQGVTPPPGCPQGHLFVPEMLRSDVIRRGHCSKVACNPGVSSTMFLFKQHFWWPSMAHDIQWFVLLCLNYHLPERQRLLPLTTFFVFMASRWTWSLTGGLSQFFSKFCSEFCHLLGATVSLSSGLHPQSNGQTERAHQDLQRMLQCLFGLLESIHPDRPSSK